MAKRFIDTDLFRKPFMRGLEAPYKALWVYLLCECDHAGIWTVELDVAELRMGMKLDAGKAIQKMGGAVVEIDGGKKWFLPDFVTFQYGTLNPANRVHESVIALLSKFGIDPNNPSQNKGHVSPLQGAKDKDKDTLKEKERARPARTIEERRSEFIAACKLITDANPARLEASQRKGFTDYWTEPNKAGKMRFEAEKFFDHGRRMDTWMSNALNRAGNGHRRPVDTAERRDIDTNFT